MKYWLFNRDPYNGLVQSPIHPKQPGFLHCSHVPTNQKKSPNPNPKTQPHHPSLDIQRDPEVWYPERNPPKDI